MNSEQRDELEEKRSAKIVEALKTRGVSLDEKREGNTVLVRAVDSKGQHRGVQGSVKKGETAAALRRRLLWTIAIDVEHDATNCACAGNNCPAAAALLRRLSGMELPR